MKKTSDMKPEIIKPNSDSISISSLEDIVNSFLEQHEQIQLCLDPILSDKKMLMYVVLGGKNKKVKQLLTQRKLPKSGTDLFRIAQWAKEIGFEKININPIEGDGTGTDFVLETDLEHKDLQVSKLTEGKEEVFTNITGSPKKYKDYFRFIDSLRRGTGFRSVVVKPIKL